MSVLKIQTINEARFAIAWWATDDDCWGDQFRPDWGCSAVRQHEILQMPIITKSFANELEFAMIHDAIFAAVPESELYQGFYTWNDRKIANEALKAARAAIKDCKQRIKTRTPPDLPWMVQARAAGWTPPKDNK